MRNTTVARLVRFGYISALLNWLLRRGNNLNNSNLRQADSLELLSDPRVRSLTPLLYQEIRERGLDEEMPQSVLEWLRNNYVMSMVPALQQERDMVELLRALGDAGVTPILLKGADARLRLYGNPVVRPMSDLDILITPEELPRTQEILAGLGYKPASEFRPGFGKRFMGQIHLTSANRRLMVDLHWYIEAVANFYRLPYQRLGQMAIPWEFEGLPVKLLAPEHFLIHLCLHNYDEVRDALHIIDMGLALTRLSIDWSLFLQEATFFQSQAPVFLMLDGLKQIFPEAVPETVLSSLNRYRPSCAEELALSPRFGKVFSPLARLYYQRRLSDCAVYLRAIIWPDPDYLVAVSGRPDRTTYLFGSLKRFLTN